MRGMANSSTQLVTRRDRSKRQCNMYLLYHRSWVSTEDEVLCYLALKSSYENWTNVTKGNMAEIYNV